MPRYPGDASHIGRSADFSGPVGLQDASPCAAMVMSSDGEPQMSAMIGAKLHDTGGARVVPLRRRLPLHRIAVVVGRVTKRGVTP